MDQINKKLANLVYNYSISEKLPDSFFVDEVIDLLLDKFDVLDYVKTYEIKTTSIDNACGSYSIEEKKIVIDLLMHRFNVFNRIQVESSNGVKTTEFNRYVKACTDIINCIAHELTHAKQYKKCLEGDDDLEKALLEMDMIRNLTILKGKYISKETGLYFDLIQEIHDDLLYYICTPSERIANINGLEFEKDVSFLLDDNLKDNIENYTKIRYLNGIIQAYKGYAPSTFFMCVNEKLKMEAGLKYKSYDLDEVEDNFKDFCDKFDLSFEERLYYGLPITNDEESALNNEIRRLTKSL